MLLRAGASISLELRGTDRRSVDYTSSRLRARWGRVGRRVQERDSAEPCSHHVQRDCACFLGRGRAVCSLPGERTGRVLASRGEDGPCARFLAAQGAASVGWM